MFRGKNTALEFVAVAAAGGHNLLMSGTPGCGKSMVAKRIPTILPAMTEEEALEVTKIYSVAGLLKNRGTLITERPFRSPHHSASTNSLVGGGMFAMPGEISLAHNGVLFLDEVAEFNKKTLDALRQPIEDGKISVSRVRHTHVFPSKFMLVAAMNPCPCGFLGDPEKTCICSQNQILNYQKRLSGPLLDRIDLTVSVSRVPHEKLLNNKMSTKSQQETFLSEIHKAYSIQRNRYKCSYKYNNDIPSSNVDKITSISESAKTFLTNAARKLDLSTRSYFKVIKVSRTIADLEGSTSIEVPHIAESLQYRQINIG